MLTFPAKVFIGTSSFIRKTLGLFVEQSWNSNTRVDSVTKSIWRLVDEEYTPSETIVIALMLLCFSYGSAGSFKNTSPVSRNVVEIKLYKSILNLSIFYNL